MTVENQAFDRTAALDIVDGDEVLLKVIISEARKELAQQLTTLDAAIVSKEANDIQRIAHTIKGTALAAAANHSKQAAESLEHAAAAGDLSSLAAQVDELKLSVQRFLAETLEFES